eukprot:TRINITY_DN110507_c0_g1_i1.p1 TRINITY_DN110507_c0_g1~~TRINITY_DN110507_c0_g1_i1.p1  ORF type:complete len:633 (+),score=131.09 TRINITY_DN110507_c0_g1_i1:44-1900(+)
MSAAENVSSGASNFGSRPLTPTEYAHAQALVTDTLSPQFKPAGDLALGEREIQIADLEVKIRQFILDLTQPTIRKTVVIESNIEALQADVALKSTQLADLMRMSQKVQEQVDVVEGFRQEMAKFDADRKHWQSEATESLASMKQDQEAFRYQLERQEASIHSVHRTVDRVTGELSRLQDVSDAVRDHVDKRLAQQNKTLNTFKTDLEVKLVNLETRLNQLADELWSEETGLSKVIHDLGKTNKVVCTMNSDLIAMKHDKASIQQLNAVQEEVNNFTNEANGSINSLKSTVDRMMVDVKEHFKTATNTVAAHNAAMLQEVRCSYQQELAEAGQLRGDVMSFMSTERENRTRLEDSLCQSQGQTEELLRKVCQDVEEVGKMRRRDRNSSEVEIRQLQHSLETVQATSEKVAETLSHVSSIAWTLVQCERAASALDLQDDQDRGKIALMGYKEQEQKKDKDSKKRSSSQARDKEKKESQGGRGDAAVLDVDQRCLSCSGKAQTVLSGFKMACLQYTPGPVPFAKKFYHRSELLSLREKLLQQANDALLTGPIQFNKTEIFGGAQSQMPSGGAIAEGLLADRKNQQSTSNASLRTSSAGRNPSEKSGTSMPPLPARSLATAR